MKKNMKILIIRFHAIGDVVMSSIIPYAIKLKHPECEIHYLTNEINVVMLKNCPHVDKVMTLTKDLKSTAKDFAAEKYDCIICLNLTLRSLYLTLFSFPKRFFFKSHKGTSWVDNYFYTAKKLFKDITMPDRLYFSNNNRSCEESIMKQIEKYPRPYIIFGPGKYENQPRQGRVWNIDKWKELSEKVLKEYGGTIFVLGEKAENEYHQRISGENVVITSGLYNIEESCALISHCDLMVSGDSGPIHIASAYNKKTLAVLGSTSPAQIKPYGKNGYFVGPTTKCKYCWKKRCKYLEEERAGYAPCIESISPDMVMDKIKENNLL